MPLLEKTIFTTTLITKKNPNPHNNDQCFITHTCVPLGLAITVCSVCMAPVRLRDKFSEPDVKWDQINLNPYTHTDS